MRTVLFNVAIRKRVDVAISIHVRYEKVHDRKSSYIHICDLEFCLFVFEATLLKYRP